MGLSFFPKKSGQTLKALIKELANIEDRLDALRGELNDAKGAALAASEEAERAVFERASADKIEAAHHRLTQAELTTKTLVAVIKRYEAALAEKRAEHDAIVRAELAEKTAAMHEKDLSDYQSAALAAVDAMRSLIGPAEKIADVSFAAAEISGFAQSISRDLALSVEHTAAELAYLIDGLRAGRIAPSMPVEHEPVAPTTVAPVIERRTVLALAPIEWREDDRACVCGRYSQGALPVAIAARAIELGYGLDFADPQCRALVRMHSATATVPGAKVNVRLDDPSLQNATPIFGSDRVAADAGVHDSHGKSYVVHGGI
ncbi:MULTISPECIES: hypothetical protein [Bradyrhizobium]|uniref:hypothetical protein n=1 Tax=Bradyrhizobium elkanii TaxID=29448 RepID=UPI002715111B|nr:hypothetical protein [Bradyrhizobium elkanii]WLA51693.1 hypothetical protein QIH80_17140 [Bradyrhizobium elkanii]WLB78000.1 hypothetical protein QIH83_27015 [Bradyrhizobium elkanii]